MTIWHILTTSYPPYRGGLGFHSSHLGECLAARGDRVVVWSAFNPHLKEQIRRYSNDPKVEHYRIAEQWDQQSFEMAAAQIMRLGGSLLVQYRPQAFAGGSARGLVNFLKTLQAHKRRCAKPPLRVGIMIHRVVEDASPAAAHAMTMTNTTSACTTRWQWWDALVARVGTSTYLRRWMEVIQQLIWTRQIMRQVDFVFVTSLRLAGRLRWLAAGWHHHSSVEVMPVSSPVVHQAVALNIHNLRQAFLAERSFIVGTYSSFKEPEVLSVLAGVMVSLLKKHRSWVWLGFGRFSADYFKFLASQHPDIAERLLTAGELDHGALSVHVATCDVLFQPYYCGVNTQRASAMVVLDHGKPLVTSVGRDTEKIWHNARAVRLHPWRDYLGFQVSIEELAAQPSLRDQLGRRGKQLYDQMFSWQTKRGMLARMSQPVNGECQ